MRLPRIAFITASSIVLVDQVTKALAVEILSQREPIKVLGPLLSLDLVRNPGAAFSLGTGNTVVFTIISAVVAVVISKSIINVVDARWAVGLGMFLAGAVGNLIDRLLRAPGFPEGHVIDMFRLPNFPVFNVADMSLTFSVAVMLWLSMRGVEPWPDKNTQEKK